MRPVFCIALLITIVTLGWGAAPTAHAQDPPDDLTTLSLEELMALEVIPIDVLGTHIHVAGEWMVGYKFSYMQMSERSGAQNAAEGYMMRPTRMDMAMHMVELMYGLTDRLTLMAMLPYRRLHMKSRTQSGESFTTQSAGIGDVQVMGHYALYKKNADYLIAKAALSLPTGSIDARDEGPAGADQRLPYPMQLGAGTYGLILDLTCIDQVYNWAWGAHATGTFRLGRNDRSYRPGHEYHLGAWITRRLTDWMAPLLHADLHVRRDVEGADPALNPSMMPTADPDRQGSAHFTLGPGLSFYVPGGTLEGQRLALKAPVPVYESRNGAPLERNWRVTLIWQWTF